MLESVVTILLTTASIIGAISVIWKGIIKPIKTSFSNLSNIYETLEKYLPTIVEISTEFKPNGGSSIKDVLNRIDKNTQGHVSRLWTLLETSPLGYFEADVDGECVKVNKRWLELANISADSYKGYGWINGIDPKDRARVVEEWKECLAQNREFHSIYSMNSGVTVKGSAIPIKTNAGETLGWLGHIEAF